MERLMMRSVVMVSFLMVASSIARAGDVKGRVEMPDACSPTVSPAVVTLEPLDSTAVPDALKSPASMALTINQHGLQFEPRVQVVRVGQTIRFTNQDKEFHNVHSLNRRDYDFDRRVAQAGLRYP
jgi:high-affinity iron transporter